MIICRFGLTQVDYDARLSRRRLYLEPRSQPFGGRLLKPWKLAPTDRHLDTFHLFVATDAERRALLDAGFGAIEGVMEESPTCASK